MHPAEWDAEIRADGTARIGDEPPWQMPSDQIEHDVPTHRQDDPDRAPVQPIFVHTHIAWPMQLVFDTPVPTHPVQELRRFQYLTADDGHFLDRP